jgi:hypothetical protein
MPDDVLAEEMPDCCDRCDDGAIYWPSRWRQGTASYRCQRMHLWTCGWGHGDSGDAPENIGVRR